MPWYKVITMPGFRLGRTDPSQDPGGVLAAEALNETATAQNLPALKTLATEQSDVYSEDPEEADIQTGQLDGAFMYEADANSQDSPYVKLTGTNLAGEYTIALINNAPHEAAAEAFIKFLLGPTGQAEMKADNFEIVSPAKVTGTGVPSALVQRSRVVSPGRSPGLLRGLGALLVLYLAFPVGAFVYRVVERGQRRLGRPRALAGLGRVGRGRHDLAADRRARRHPAGLRPGPPPGLAFLGGRAWSSSSRWRCRR